MCYDTSLECTLHTACAMRLKAVLKAPSTKPGRVVAVHPQIALRSKEISGDIASKDIFKAAPPSQTHSLQMNQGCWG
eukprot:1474109-Pleurochrysis_carterae.AAC.1